jgi:hypothetical protein
LQLEKKINQLTKQISVNPELFPISETNKELYKATVDKNNYLVYRVNTQKGSLEIVHFRGTKQKPKH